MYLASKYEDVLPLNSKVVSEKIAHGIITPKMIVDKEREFLQMFQFQMDFITPYDFWQTYTDKVEKQLMHNLGQMQESPFPKEKVTEIMAKLNEMTMILIKMSVQCADFLPYSSSTMTISAMYSATAFLKHSKDY